MLTNTKNVIILQTVTITKFNLVQKKCVGIYAKILDDIFSWQVVATEKIYARDFASVWRGFQV